MHASSSSPRINFLQPSQPFYEISSLSNKEIEKKTEKLMDKGYFTVKISDSTKAFLNKLDTTEGEWRENMIAKKKSLVGTPYEKALTTTANRIVESITGNSASLNVQECEVRQLKGTGASLWHQDKQPKKLVAITTINGSPTEYVAPEAAAHLFKKADNAGDIEMYATSQAEVAPHINKAKKDRFYFFAARGLDPESVPKLVHRAPHEEGRSIFMTRWN